MRIRSALLPLLLLFVGLSACNGESEGQPCLVDSDCSGSLTCRQSPNYPTTDGLRCCPMSAAQATTPECMALTSGGFDASPAVPDAAFETGTPDAPAEAAPETGTADTGASVDASSTADAADATLPPDAADGAPANDGSGE